MTSRAMESIGRSRSVGSVDEEALMDRVDEDMEFLEGTVGMLDEDCPSLLKEVRAAATSRDAETLVKSAPVVWSVFVELKLVCERAKIRCE